MRLVVFLLLCLVMVVPLQAQDMPTIQRCINLGNALEAPNEGDWGFIIRQSDLETIAEAGFDTVRIPIRWSAHADTEFPYTIDRDFFARIDEVVGWALEAELQVIIDLHHYVRNHDGACRAF